MRERALISMSHIEPGQHIPDRGEAQGETTFHVATYGCQMNVYDSDWLKRALRAKGLKETGPETAQVHIVTTCSVREKPELKVYSHLGRLKSLFDKHPNGFAAVGGCVAQQIGKGFFERFPFVRLVFGPDGTAGVPGAVEQLLADPSLRLCLTDFEENYTERDPFPQGQGEEAPLAGPGQGFVSIMQGCDNFCAYCIVPYVRGRQKSRPSESVLAECRALVERGVREITLLGQNVNSYGQDKAGHGVSFAELLAKVAGMEGVDRLKFTTSHPKDIDRDVIAAFGEYEALCPQLHLPLQAGSDRVLKAMGRRYDMARYREIVKGLRQARPDIALTTDLLVGFPGETDEDFQRTLEAMDEFRFSAGFSFMYSDRPGVRAEKMDNKVEEAVKAERLARLQALQENHTNEHLHAMIGKQVTMLVEGPGSIKALDGSLEQGLALRGRDEYNHSVNAAWPEETVASQGNADIGWSVGKLVFAEITRAKKHSLAGVIRGTPW
ncbi:MAG: tRNA (N6-isopentenyl adenosine(37)-C2)-methylthiotransferase MiaB [Desulfovibrio sp.]|nr:MAG: tRNA (N6-isopentenyl adenosine(37)-C2)-methylthiotransferase MiaB [Desulfovibrio sp.]